jgi:CheY-like chemotaxis protein
MRGPAGARFDAARWGLQGFLRGATLLLVEDDASVRDAVGLLLDSLGAHVLLAVDGADARGQLDTSCPDLMLSDLAMPNVNGHMLIQQLRHDRTQADLPAIAMSAFADPEDSEGTIPEGFDAFVRKPFDEAALWSALAGLMSRRPGLFKRQRERLRHRAKLGRIKARSERWRARQAVRRSGLASRRMNCALGTPAA